MATPFSRQSLAVLLPAVERLAVEEIHPPGVSRADGSREENRTDEREHGKKAADAA